MFIKYDANICEEKNEKLKWNVWINPFSFVSLCVDDCFCAYLMLVFVYPPLRYMKYLYPYECERKGLSSPGELQAAIDSNRREGRRPSYSSSLFRFSPSPSTAPHILSPPKMHLSGLGAGTSVTLNGLQASPGPSMKKGSYQNSDPPEEIFTLKSADFDFWNVAGQKRAKFSTGVLLS